MTYFANKDFASKSAKLTHTHTHKREDSAFCLFFFCLRSFGCNLLLDYMKKYLEKALVGDIFTS